MRKPLLIFALLVASTFASATPTFVRGAAGGNPTSSLNFASNAAGNTLIVMVESVFGFATVTDSAGNQYKMATIAVGSGWDLYMYYAENCVASAGTNTVTVSSPSGGIRMAIAEYSGVATVRPFRTVGWGNGSSATATTQALTTVSGDLVVAFGFMTGSGITAGTGYTARNATDGLGLFEDKIATGTSETPTFTGGNAEWSIEAIVLSPTTNSNLPDTGFVRSNSIAATGVTSTTITLPANGAGDLMVLGVTLNAALTVSASDGTNTWKQGFNVKASSQTVAILYAENVASSAGTVTVTITWGGTSQNVKASIVEYSGVVTTGAAGRFFGCGGICTDSSESVPVFPGDGAHAATATNDLVVVYSNADLIFSVPSNYNSRNGITSDFTNRFYDGLGAANMTVPGDVSAFTASSEHDSIAVFKRTGSGASNLIQGRVCNEASPGTVSCTLPNATTIGNLYVAAYGTFNTATPVLGSFSDTLGLSLALDGAGACTSACHQSRFNGFVHAPITSSGTETISYAGAGGYAYFGVFEFANYGTSIVASSACPAPGACTPPSPPAVTVPTNNSLMLEIVEGNSCSTSTPADVILPVPIFCWGWAVVSSGSQTFTGDNGSGASLAIFGPATAGVRHRVVNQ